VKEQHIMNKLRLNSECIGCNDSFTPNPDGIPLCEFCKMDIANIRIRFKTMLAVNGASLVSNIERLSEKDTARFDAIYQMKIKLPGAGSTTAEMAAHRLAHSEFAIRIAATKRKADALSAVLQLQDICKELQHKLDSLDTLEQLI
jgi:hypothetical protein